ncbi:MAG: hypothetical protein AB1422_12600 [bacterium]
MLKKNIMIVVLGGVISVWLTSFSFAAFKFEGVGARPLGMGGAFVGLANDINTLYYNPAGLADIRERIETYMYSQKLEVLKYHYVGIAQKNVGFSFVTQNTGDELGGKNINQQKLDMSESVLALSYGGYIIETMPELALGGNLRVLNLNSPTRSGSGFCFDIGALYKHPMYEHISYGVVIRNINAETLDEEIDEVFSVGVGYKLDSPKMIFAADITTKKDYAKTSDTKYGYNLGLEYTPIPILAVRLGLADGNITWGMGFAQEKWQLDYAFGSIDAIEDFNNHYISCTLKF